MSALPAILLAATTTVKMVGEIKEGQQQSATEKYNARVAEVQAQAYKTTGAFQAQTLQKQSDVEQAQITRAKQQTLSEQRAQYAKSGVRINEGSPIEVMADTATQYELDLAANRYNLQTGLEKIRYESEVGSAKSLAEAEYRRKLAKGYRGASYLKAGTTLLTSLAGANYGGGSAATKIGSGSGYTGSAGGFARYTS